jgi:hypothetical protein
MYKRSLVCDRLGMASSKRKETKRRAQELARRLEYNPELLERFESIINLSQSDELKTVDAIEEVLIEEVRKLGGETLGSWASRREEQLAKTLREENEKVRMRKKKRCISTPPSEKSK